MSVRRILMVGVVAVFCLLPWVGCQKADSADPGLSGSGGAASSHTTTE